MVWQLLAAINWVPFLVSLVGGVIIATVWYGPLFGNLWIKGLGYDSLQTAKKQWNKIVQLTGFDLVLSFALQLAVMVVMILLVSKLQEINDERSYLIMFILAIVGHDLSRSKWEMRHSKSIFIPAGCSLLLLLYYVSIYHILGSALMG